MADSAPAPEATSTAEIIIVAHKPESAAVPAQLDPSSAVPPLFPNPNPRAPPSVSNPPQPLIQPSFSPASPVVPVPSVATTPQFSPIAFQTPGVPHLGLSMASVPAVGSGLPPQIPVAAALPGISPPYPMGVQPMRFVPPMSNGYPAIPQPFPKPVPQGIGHYPSYAPMIRPTFAPRPLIGVMRPLVRSPVVGIRGSVIPHIVARPPATLITTAEEPQTTVYVGKISSTMDNDFMLSLLKLCGPVKNWKRPQDPTGTLKGFGFCEFESADGVLRALRLLNKLSIDGRELMLNVNQTTRKYLELHVERKTESLKKQSETDGGQKEEASASSSNTNGAVKASEESDEQKNYEDEMNKDDNDASKFGLITDEDRDADREAHDKLVGMIEERLKNNPLPPPPSRRPVDGPGKSLSEHPSMSRDKDSEGDVTKNDLEDKTEDEKTAESKLSSELERTDTGSPDRSRRHDRSRNRDRELRREKERELERYERDREQERAKREKEREYRSWEDERRYKVREKEWEAREREREHWRKKEREREKQKAHERKWEILDQEHDDDDGYGKKRKYKISDEERKRRQREKEEDLADRLREEEEIEEAKIWALEEQKKQLEVLKLEEPANGCDKTILPDEINDEDHLKAAWSFGHKLDHGASEGEEVLQNGTSDDFVASSNSDACQSSILSTRKLGFGLSGSGKRATVPSVFKEDEDEEAHKDKKMRPLVPIDYSTEEKQVTEPSIPEGSSIKMAAAAAEYAKRILATNAKEEKPDLEKDRNRRSHDRSSHRDRGRYDLDHNSTHEQNRKDILDRERSNKLNTSENQKLLDAKQLIDTIPKTKDELFSYEIHWAIYDQNSLQERMRPWISKKITDYLGEEEDTLVDYIVSSTQEHVEASEMLERLQTILDDEAEMFVLKMWRMLIFEIKKVETGLALRPRA